LINSDKIIKLSKLVENFKFNINEYKSNRYNEEKNKIDFIDKFFLLLDWDMYNEAGYNETYREVLREDIVYVKGSAKAPDYTFKIGKERKFFVEAKKPSIYIKEDMSAAYQLRSYAYSAKLPLSILTDFEEFSVYDTRIAPKPDDKASNSRIFYTTFEEYNKDFDFIYNIFSKQAVFRGSFDKYADDNKNKKGTSEIDREILKLIETWRFDLVKNIALRNKDLGLHNLNLSVQKIIDRIIFLRIAEDKGIEKEYQLLELTNKNNIYEQLQNIFIEADKKYNSGLFENREWINKLLIDDKVLHSIIKSIYYPLCHYQFSVIPVEILGNIYEQFLGKTIRLTESHQAKIEEKPEVRKAGGVHYTPQFIVDNIVENTIGVTIKDKDPDKVSQLKILDPSCGSGSFLVGAYTYLLDWHQEYYAKNPQKHIKEDKIYQVSEKSYRLTIKEKQRILLNNIYGVDIDDQAVEVTKLSLLLKLMENEQQESTGFLFKHSDLKMLPDLKNNIKSGNSLISSDYYYNKDMSLFDDENIRKINAFDWNKEFPFKFDIIIGNPPYGAYFSENEKKYLQNKYPNVADYESSNYFILLSYNLLKSKSKLSFIVPNTFLANLFAKNYRLELLEKWELSSFVNLSNIDVFKDAKVRTMIIFFEKNNLNENYVSQFKNFNSNFDKNKDENDTSLTIPKSKLYEKIDNWLTLFTQDNEIIKIIEKIKSNTEDLKNFCDISQGLIPYDKYRGHSKQTIKNRIWHANYQKDDTYKKEIQGSDLKRYYLKWNGKTWISYGNWLAAPRKREFFTNERIIIREITNPVIMASVTNEEYYNTPSIINCINFKNFHIYYFLSIINSKLMSFYHIHTSPKAKKGLFPKILVNDVRNLPIKTINLANEGDKIKHQNLTNLVDQIIDSYKKLDNSDDETNKKTNSQRIEILDRQIDEVVYNLYGLSADEIKIIEEQTKLG